MEFENLKNLSNQAMVAATKEWVEPGDTRNALAAVPETAGFLAPMGAAQEGLLQLQVVPAANPAVDAMVEKALALDGNYDRIARAVDLIAEGNALLHVPGSPAAHALDALRTRIFPAGRSITQATYLEEAGEADLVEKRLRPEDRALLATVPTVAGTLDTAVTEWIQTGTELGALVRDRTRITESEEESDAVSRADALKARNRWIRVVRAILAAIELSDDLDDETRNRILQPLRDAVEKAAEKNKSKDAETIAPAAETAATSAL